MIYIMADDLTGANDSGVQLSKQGLKTMVYIDPLCSDENDTSGILNTADVLVVDTETRDLSEDQAGQIISKAVERLQLENRSDILFYKKIDSTLRGNIGKEIEVLMELLNKDLCIISPSFPHNKRITAGGYLLVNNEPLGTSQYFSGQLEPWEGTYIPHFIQQQTQLPVGLIELKDVMKGETEILNRLEILYKEGKKIIIIDAVIEHHLKEIMNSSRKFQGSILYCGSAGLANYLVDLNEVKKRKIKKLSSCNQPILTVIGTRNKIMEKQIEYYREMMSVSYLKIDLKGVLRNKRSVFLEYKDQAIRAIKGGKHLILHPDPIYNGEGGANNLIKKEQISFRELEVIIRDFLARLTATIVRTAGVENLILTGGDTAIGVCKELGINSLIILDELLPGIPLSFANNKHYKNIKLITKAGGFGGEDTLYQLALNLINYGNAEVKV
ncbi:MAG: D-threonate/D-erythronate kinase [Halanaerobiales bacterium]|nr:D-threonate/D-erythronate kinase [Halanaerobiales bacterium]